MSQTAARTVDIVNKRGLHARASAKFVRAASAFDAEVRVSKDSQTVDARSIMGLMMLAAGPGCCIEIEAEGGDILLDVLGGLLEGHQDAGLVKFHRAADEEFDAEQ